MKSTGIPPTPARATPGPGVAGPSSDLRPSSPVPSRAAAGPSSATSASLRLGGGPPYSRQGSRRVPDLASTICRCGPCIAHTGSYISNVSPAYRMILEVRASTILRRSRQAGEGACIERCGEAMLPVAVLRSVEISGVWAAKEADVPYPKLQHRPVAHRARRRGRRTGCSQAPGCSHWVLKPAPSVRVTKAGVGGAAAMVASVGRAGPATARSRADDQQPPTTRRVLLLARMPPARRALPLAQEGVSADKRKEARGVPPSPPRQGGVSRRCLLDRWRARGLSCLVVTGGRVGRVG